MRIVPLTAMLLGLMLVSGCSHPDRVGDGPVAPARAALPPLPERWRAVADAAGPMPFCPSKGMRNRSVCDMF